VIAGCGTRVAVVAWPDAAADLAALLDANDAVVCCASVSDGEMLVREILDAALAGGSGSFGAGMGSLRPGVRLDVSGAFPEQLDLQRSPRGKPYVAPRAGQLPLNFNISHSGSVLLVALSRTADVGVDVERVRVVPEWRAIARRMFEPAVLDQLPADDGDAFVRHWCRLEAAVKATGEGLFARNNRDDANDANDANDADAGTDPAPPRVIDLPHLPLPAGAARYRAALALRP
jgi:hypothetical protein